MAADPERFVGRTYTGEFTVDPSMVHQWADATGNPDDRYRRPDDGAHAVPPTLAPLLAREATGADSIETELRAGAADEAGVFLGGQGLATHRPLAVGATYRAEAVVPTLERKSGESGDFAVLTVEYDVETAWGDPAFEAYTELVVRLDGGTGTVGGETVDGETARGRWDVTDPPPLDDLEPGDAFERTVNSVSAADFRVVSALLREPNPVHYDAEYAAEQGLPGRVSQGPLNAAYAVQAAMAVADGPADLRSLDARFEAFVFEGETVTAVATVDALQNGGDGERTVVLDLELLKNDGTVALTGTATVRQ